MYIPAKLDKINKIAKRKKNEKQNPVILKKTIVSFQNGDLI